MSHKKEFIFNFLTVRQQPFTAIESPTFIVFIRLVPEISISLFSPLSLILFTFPISLIIPVNISGHSSPLLFSVILIIIPFQLLLPFISPVIFPRS